MNTLTTICLVMMVKNEAPIILDTLRAVATYIDHAVIIDSGSTDGTQDIMEKFFQDNDIQFAIFNNNDWTETGMKGGGQKRTEALARAQYVCDYRLLLDADNIFHVQDLDFKKNIGGAGAYYLTKKCAHLEYQVPLLFKSDQVWEYVGVLHEYSQRVDGPTAYETLSGVTVIESTKDAGHRQRGREYYYGHALAIETELLKSTISEQLRIRYWFYLAQSYQDAGMIERAIECYNKRLSMGGWVEETYITMLRLALLHKQQGMHIEHVISLLLTAWEFRQHRMEAAYEVMQILNAHGRHRLSYMVGDRCLQVDVDITSRDLLFVDQDIQRWKFYDAYSIAAYYCGYPDEAYDITMGIAARVPDDQLDRIHKNIEFFKAGMKNLELSK